MNKIPANIRPNAKILNGIQHTANPNTIAMESFSAFLSLLKR